MHHLTWLDALAVMGAGLLAGTINTIVGSGSLITFPVLVAVGVPPFVANVSNNVGLIGGNVSGVYGYRRELVGQGHRIRSLAPWSVAGGALGAGLLLIHPSSFRSVVPYLVLLAVAMVVAQPRLTKFLAARGGESHEDSLFLRAGVFLTAVYGGYFGAAQGVILIAILAIALEDHLQRLNGFKNVAVGLVNMIAGVLFIAFAPVNWAVVGLIAASSTVGAQFGARIGRKLPPQVLRAIIVCGGLSVAIYLLT